MSRIESIRAKLKNIAERQNMAFQNILFRYFHERFLYRLANSEYADNFFLKGGVFLYACDGIYARQTKDIDFLGFDIVSDSDALISIFATICNIEFEPDAVVFDSSNINKEIISEQNENRGIRIFINAGLGNIKQRIQIDIGYGDIVVPNAQTIEYPVLLDVMPAPIVKAYTTETVIAEKFQAMIELAELNSRMKDFYDVFTILKKGNYHTDILTTAIKSTFKNRNTNFQENHILFSEHFTADKNRIKMWEAFLKKININTDMQFKDVIKIITEVLKPIWDTL
ncbi:MAG: nucleotidyl transferase AbiEii/AbiGii toxin family protein [Bacteroidales bacterium]|nr:nucleotidyl transferase AbiEii/AbiGii toxin family protein [Bacteroidales bacterium]